MTAFTSEDIPPNHANPESQQEPEGQDYGYVFEAPNYADFIKPKTSGKAKDYENKTASLLKSWFWASMHSQNAPDAATILDKGPAFAAATGKMAASNEKVAKMVDMITSPESPTFVFVAAAFAFGAQLLRNHEPELQQIPQSFRQRRSMRKAHKSGQAGPEMPRKPLFTLHVLGRKIPIGARFNVRLGILFGPARSQTVPPQLLVQKVFSDSRVQKALEKEGIFFRFTGPEPEDG